jgi:hypothetical protein
LFVESFSGVGWRTTVVEEFPRAMELPAMEAKRCSMFI